MSGKGKRKPGNPKTDKRVQNTAENDAVNSDVSPEAQEEKFQRELAWCIEQIELGITSSKTKPSSSQAQDAVKFLKVLKNPKAPLVKKRQAMRNAFGDYRKKMETESKKFGAKARKVAFKSTPQHTEQKCTYLRRRQEAPTPHVTSVDGSQEAPTSGPDRSQDGEQSAGFKFNFMVEDSPQEVAGDTDNAGSDCLDSVAASSLTCNSDTTSTKVNYFKMSTSDNDFTFNFDVSEHT